MSNVPIALQLFSVRGECKNDLPATLKAVAELGYVGVEPWGYQGDQLEWMGFRPDELRKLLDDNGLACCGMHLGPAALEGDRFERTVELNQTLGNKFLIVAGDKARMSAVDTIAELADMLNSIADKLQPLGMFTGYHAHPFDFELVEGEPAWYRLFRQTREDVIMQMDTGNCARGGGDPVDALRTFPGRARSVHLKEFDAPEGGVIGEGKLDWPAIFDLCENAHPVEWYVVEEGGPDGMGFDVPKRSLAALHAMGK